MRMSQEFYYCFGVTMSPTSDNRSLRYRGPNWGRVDVGLSGALEVFLSGTPLVGANGLGNGTNLTMGNDGGVPNARESA